MKRTLSTMVVLLALLFTTGCSTVEVSSDYDRGGRFSTYTSFDFIPPPENLNPLVWQRVQRAVEAELVAKGMTRDTASPTLLVALQGRLSTETRIDTTTMGYSYGGWGYYGGYGGGVTTATVREIPIGTLIVDLVDAAEKRLVWQGTATDSLDPKASPEKKEFLVKEAVHKMLAAYPPQVK